MRKHLALIAAAAMTVSGMSLSARADEMANDGTAVKADVDVNEQRAQNAADKAGDRVQDTADRTGNEIGNAADRAGNRIENTADKAGDKLDKAMDGQGMHGTAMAPDAEGIRDILASVTEAALTEGGFDDLVERLNDHDRNRIGDFAEKDFTELDGRIAQIQKAWQDKYGEEFDIEDEEAVYPESFARIMQGEVADEARLAGERMEGEAKVDGVGEADVAVDNQTGVDMPGDNVAADKNLNDPGRNLATVKIPASHGKPALTVKMIHEMPDNWRIDLDDSMTGQQLHDNLLAALTKVGEDSANWPEDKTEAYRSVSHAVLAALHGKTLE